MNVMLSLFMEKFPLLCPICNAWTTTKDTRQNKIENFTYRKKECANGHLFTTEEKISVQKPKGFRNRKTTQDKEMFSV